jgi:hypothetical protein
MKIKLLGLTTLVLLSALAMGCVEQARVRIKPERQKEIQTKVLKYCNCNKPKYLRKRDCTNSKEKLGIENESIVGSIISTIKLIEDENEQNKKEKIQAFCKFREKIRKQIDRAHKRHQEKLEELYKQYPINKSQKNNEHQEYKSQREKYESQKEDKERYQEYKPKEDKIPKFYRQRFHRTKN